MFFLKKRKAIFLFLIAVLVFTASVAGCGQREKPGGDSEESNTGPASSDKTFAPDFKLKDLFGKEVSLGDFKGKRLILNFWATTCPYCVEEMPELNRFHKDFRDKGYTVVGINLGEDKKTVKRFIKEGDYDFIILLDPSLETPSHYVVPGLPTTYFIDEEGVIVDIKLGAVTYNDLVDMIKVFEK